MDPAGKRTYKHHCDWVSSDCHAYLKGWLSTLCCWEAAVHALDLSWKKMDVKLMMMMMMMG